jgi:hypothetical protein
VEWKAGGLRAANGACTKQGSPHHGETSYQSRPRERKGAHHGEPRIKQAFPIALCTTGYLRDRLVMNMIDWSLCTHDHAARLGPTQWGALMQGGNGRTHVSLQERELSAWNARGSAGGVEYSGRAVVACLRVVGVFARANDPECPPRPALLPAFRLAAQRSFEWIAELRGTMEPGWAVRILMGAAW